MSDKPVLMKLSDNIIIGMVNDVPAFEYCWDAEEKMFTCYSYAAKEDPLWEGAGKEAEALHYKYFIEGPLTTRVVDVAAQKANPARYERMQKVFAEVEKRAERLDEVMSTREALSIENQAVENELLKLEIEAKREQLKESQISFTRKMPNRILQ